MVMAQDADRPADEFALIAEIFAPLASGDAGSFNLTDDAAIIAPRAGHDLVITADMITAGVHFFADDPPDQIARKLLRVNLSDLAAKGAVPHGYILTAALPKTITLHWLRVFSAGLAQDQAEFSITLLGGDTTATEGPLCLSVTAMGWVKSGQMIRRNGARIGDEIFVTGTIGDAALGLAIRRDGAPAGLAQEHAEYLLSRYLLPQPRNRLAPALPGLVHAGLDISDGLTADLFHILQTSGVGAEINLPQIPLSVAARAVLNAGATRWQDLLGGGDDYELLLTVSSANAPRLVAAGESAGLSLTRIGRITAGNTLVLVDEIGAKKPVTPQGYRHF